ncbi:DUF6503 family protein [uncultured Croceitalea sp.]
MRFFVPFLTLLFSFSSIAQELSGTELLEKAIAFHDPNRNWETFIADLKIIMKTPKSADRLSLIHMDLSRELFILTVEKENDLYTYELEKDSCTFSLNGSLTISDSDKKRLRLNCERGKMMKNYYTYLYGLPMKLKDPGTIINQEVEKRTFKEKQYLVLKVNYTKEVGEDTWYFYFDPHTYAMEVYQFFHDESKNDGEYILLEGLENIHEIKMPKIRAWYYNKDDKYLGTDVLNFIPDME